LELKGDIMSNYKLAEEFVKKYSNMFTEDHDFWIQEIKKLLEASNKELIDSIINRVKEL
jgi:ribosomal protein S17E